jgi:hypothetical protein
LSVAVADAKAWAAWTSAAVASLETGVEEGSIAPRYTPSDDDRATLDDLTAAISALDDSAGQAELALPPIERVRSLIEHLDDRQQWHDRLAEYGLLPEPSPPEARRFLKHLTDRLGRPPGDRGFPVAK